MFQDALAARLDARAARPVDDCKAAAGGTYRMLLDVIMTRLSWRFLKHTSAVSARRFRVEVVVEGRTLAAGEGDSKLSANESASEAVVRDLLAIERSARACVARVGVCALSKTPITVGVFLSAVCGRRMQEMLR